MSKPHQSKPRHLKLGAMVHGVGHGWGEWRHPQAQPNASVNFAFYKQQAHLAEALFGLCLADGGRIAFDLRLVRAGAGPQPGGDGQGDQDNGQQRNPPGSFEVAWFQFHGVSFRVI